MADILSDKFGARRIMYWTFLVSVVCTFILSYPPTSYVVEGIRGPVTFSTRMSVVAFIVVAFVLGFFMSLGKAAVYKHIPVYYPDRVGAVGGVVGLVGGLGGFVLPIAFGALNDLTGIWQSCFWLLFLIVGASLVWMHFAVRTMEQSAVESGIRVGTLPELPEMQPIHGPKQHGEMAPIAGIQDWRPEDKAFWESGGRAIARRNLWISVPCLLLSFAVWMVWSVVVAKLPSVGFAFTNEQLFWLASLPGLSGATLRIFYSFMPAIFGGRLWTTLATWSLLIPAIGMGYAVQNPATPYWIFLALALAVRFRRRQLRLVDGQHLVLLPEGREGQCTRHQCRPRQSRRQRRAVRGADRDHRRRVRLARRRSADGDRCRRQDHAVAAERRLRVRAVHCRIGLRGVVRHERHRHHEGLVRRPVGDLHPHPQLDHVLALYRHLRLVHRLLGSVPAAVEDLVP